LTSPAPKRCVKEATWNASRTNAAPPTSANARSGAAAEGRIRSTSQPMPTTKGRSASPRAIAAECANASSSSSRSSRTFSAVTEYEPSSREPFPAAVATRITTSTAA
jgi:hypothetical protein